MTYPCVEALVEFQAERWQFRLWIARADLEPFPEEAAADIHALLRTHLAAVQAAPTVEELADYLAGSVPKLAAVQVTDLDRVGAKRGVVVYLEWP